MAHKGGNPAKELGIVSPAQLPKAQILCAASWLQNLPDNLHPPQNLLGAHPAGMVRRGRWPARAVFLLLRLPNQ